MKRTKAMYRKLIYITLIPALILLIYACASYGPLEGGPKDVTPPKIVESRPANGSTNFNGKKIQITFDEFIQLKDLQKQFVVSPPMKKAPVVVPKPRDIIVNFEEDLKPNTTYTLYFGNSIADFNEGNPFQKFDFVFSTGNHIDSLSLLGKIVNSEDHTPDKDGMFVMLYPLFNDTIPRKTLPLFIAKTDDHGWFKFNHVFADTFMIFGLKDMNMNYRFDQPGETIAFSDTLIVFDTTFYEIPDTSFKKVKIRNPKDSVKLDTTDFYAGKTPRVELYSFKEDVRKQNLNNNIRSNNNMFTLIFELPELDSVKLKILNAPTQPSWYSLEARIPNDTLNYWLTDTALIHKDTLKMQVGYYKPDSTGHNYLAYDTLKFMVKKSPGAKNKKSEQHKTLEHLSVSANVSNGSTIDLNQQMYIEPNLPFKKMDISKISLFRIEDSVKTAVKFTLKKDSIWLRRYQVLFNLQSDNNYQMVIDSGAFTNLFDTNSDSTGFSFKTQRDDYYGTIKLHIKNIICPTIVQLVTQKGDLVRQKYVDSDTTILFDYLGQGKYGFKAIYDVNKNKKWDTGNWGKRLQPEKTVFYKNEISVRSSWDMDVSWELDLPKKKKTN
jgi:hypothetical protein